jgi:hypothetical protein
MLPRFLELNSSPGLDKPVSFMARDFLPIARSIIVAYGPIQPAGEVFSAPISTSLDVDESIAQHKVCDL